MRSYLAFRPLFGVLLLLIPVLGCQRRDAVRVLELPKETMATAAPANAAPANEEPVQPISARMLAAIVPTEEKIWFFKMIGAPEVVEKVKPGFQSLVQSLSLEDPSQPQWELPEGWSSRPAGGMRLATLRAGVDQGAPLVSVIGLQPPQDTLDNINRWRDQLGLDPVTTEELPEFVDDLDVAGTTVTISDIVGIVKPNAAMNAPPSGTFSTRPGVPNPHTQSAAGAVPAGAVSTGAVPTGAATPTGGNGLQYQSPTGWSPGKSGGMRKAAFGIADDAGKAECTIIALAPAAGELLPNVNRWRDQLGLEPLEEDSLSSAVKPMTVGGAAGNYVSLMKSTETPSKATIVAMIPYGGQIWFFKLTGDAAIVEREADNFDQFLSSVTFD